MGAYYQEGNNKKLRGENTFDGGVNTGTSAFALNDNESTDEFGFDTDKHPALAVRRGRMAYGSSGAGVTNLMTNFGNQHLVRSIGTALQYNNTGTTWTGITGTFANTSWDATNFNDKLILVNGTDAPQQWNGTALSALGGTPPTAKYVTNDTNRVWMAEGDTLSWSAFLDEEDWTAAENAGSVQYYTERGGDITALRRFYDRITVFKKDCMAEVQGRTYFNFSLVEISNDIGCVSFKTLVEVGDTLFFLGQNDIYMYQGGKPSPIGQKVRSYLDDINIAYIDKCCAFTDGLKYYICLVTGDSTEPNTRLVFDPRYGVWRVPALNENYRYGVQLNNETYVGDSNGQTFKEFDGTTNNGTPIEWLITTKPFDEGAPEAEKTYLDLHNQGLFQTGTTLALSVSTIDRGGTFVPLSYDPTTSADYGQNRNVVMPLDTVPLTYKTRFRLNGTGYVEFERLQRYYRVQRVQR